MVYIRVAKKGKKKCSNEGSVAGAHSGKAMLCKHEATKRPG